MLDDTSVELTRWLQEAGRRRYRAGPRTACEIYVVPQRAERPGIRFDRIFFKNAVLLVSGAAAAIQYAYADTMLQILSLHSVIVFLFTGA